MFNLPHSCCFVASVDLGAVEQIDAGAISSRPFRKLLSGTCLSAFQQQVEACLCLLLKSEPDVCPVKHQIIHQLFAPKPQTQCILGQNWTTISSKLPNSLSSPNFSQTSNTLSWTLYHLAKDPAAQDRLYNEVNSVCPNHHQPTMDDLANMPFLKAVIKEVLRSETVVKV